MHVKRARIDCLAELIDFIVKSHEKVISFVSSRIDHPLGYL